MSDILAAPPPPPVDNTWAAPGIATVIVVVLGIVAFALAYSARGGIRTQADFLLAGRRIGVGQNALAHVAGGIMYSTVIIIVGHVALNGFDAILLLTAFVISTVLAVLIYAGPMRNLNAYTIGDLFAIRARKRPARLASAVLTLGIFGMFNVIAVGSMGFVASRMFTTSPTVDVPIVALTVGIVGLLAIAAVYVGGMPGITRVLVLKVSLMMAFVAVLTVAILAKYKLNIFDLLNDAEANAAPNPRGELLTTGRLFGEGATFNSGQDPWVHLSKAFAIAVGAIGMPFLFMRFFVARSGRAARQTAGWAAIITIGFWACMIVIGLGAVAILGGEAIGKVAAHRDITLPKIADELGGSWATGALGAIALLSVGAIFAVLLLNAVTSVTRDLRAARGLPDDRPAELKDVRRNVLILGIVSLVGGMVMMTQLTHIFIPTSIDIGAASVLPAVVLSLFWRRYNTAGLMWTVYGGIAVTLFMVVFSNGVSGDPTALFPDADFKFIDFEPGLVGAPLGFLFGFIGTLTSRERNDAAFAEMRVRALTGATIPARREPEQTATATSLNGLDRSGRTLSETH
ncbi:cation/acetate symporter [Asanoa ferruginea]|uniref:Cation/acetate symporter n=1 Tax=Asanoa ferruginea TaxID=53367 RepID=A0A3D9ZUC3_9ACTN|nr:Na+:solute symporter [Asanoa ferruginea]REG00979.1 cation/acetate symporter [Asanoa ferruginea]GIF47579.1 cation acetate symporter [Asanoa ferruginea]